MTKFNLITGNRAENLVLAMVMDLKRPLVSPLDPEIVVVHSKGMERWISLEIAKKHGICANLRFPFPNTFMHEILQKILPDRADEFAFGAEVMAWRIMERIRERLPDLIEQEIFAPVRVYLDHAHSDLKPYQLARQIGVTFEQYLLFRPDWIFRWEAGKEPENWQAALWREIVPGYETIHRAALGRAILERLRDRSLADQIGEILPPRVSIFGIPTLPPFHLQVLDAIAAYTEVNLYMLNPCREFWGDIKSRQEMRRIEQKSGLAVVGNDLGEDLYLEEGNPILAALGKQGRDFFNLIQELISGYNDISDDPDLKDAFFLDPGEETLLGAIQHDLLYLVDRTRGRAGNGDSDAGGKSIISLDDDSIRIHACHSPMREAEILHDQLLEIFKKNPDLSPNDVLVMTPEIEKYAPYIQAVFDRREDDPLKIPFTIADQSYRTESRIIDVFLQILDLRGSRFGAAQVLSILETPSVYGKFGLTESDLDLIREWIAKTRIRWGIDRENRKKLDLPDLPENTWQAGLDRLLLGYAMIGNESRMFEDILPFDDMEGEAAQVLGRFIGFTEKLFDRVGALEGKKSLSGWAELLREMIGDFFESTEENEIELGKISAQLLRMKETAEQAGYEGETDIHAVKAHLGGVFTREGFGFGFISGAVTFCAMLPMRSIPFKVICMIGMNSDSFPRRDVRPAFDLMAKAPRIGDRSLRNEDRYLFLESLLSARERLYISHVGYDIKDNSEIPPSVLVSELTDYIEKGFAAPEKKIMDHVRTAHRLQPFSPEYFRGDEEERFSFSRTHCEAAKGLQGKQKPLPPLFPKPLEPPEKEWRTVKITDLRRFLRNPAQFLLERRLNLRLEETLAALPEKEPFSLDNLERYLIGNDLVEKGLSEPDVDIGEYYRIKKACGELPLGEVGNCVFKELRRGTEGFIGKMGICLAGKPLEPLDVDLRIGDFRVLGRIDGIYPEQLIRYRYAGIKAKDRLRIWIDHLVLNIAGPKEYPKRSMLAGRNGKEWTACAYGAAGDAEALLEKILSVYWQGLQSPVPFFPETAYAYANELRKKNGDAAAALSAARTKWNGVPSRKIPGDTDDAFFGLCFGHLEDPLDDLFAAHAVAIFDPILQLEEEVKQP